MVRALDLGGEGMINHKDTKGTQKTYFVPFVPLW